MRVLNIALALEPRPDMGAFVSEPQRRLMKLKWNPIMRNSICIYFLAFFSSDLREKLMKDKFNQRRKKGTKNKSAKKTKIGGNQSCNQAIKNKSMFIKVYHINTISTAQYRVHFVPRGPFLLSLDFDNGSR